MIDATQGCCSASRQRLSTSSARANMPYMCAGAHNIPIGDGTCREGSLQLGHIALFLGPSITRHARNSP